MFPWKSTNLTLALVPRPSLAARMEWCFGVSDSCGPPHPSQPDAKVSVSSEVLSGHCPKRHGDSLSIQEVVGDKGYLIQCADFNLSLRPDAPVPRGRRPSPGRGRGERPTARHSRPRESRPVRSDGRAGCEPGRHDPSRPLVSGAIAHATQPSRLASRDFNAVLASAKCL